ncbi:UPF0602 protein C4orf47 -like protein [Collichthys lucidus]|uniref:Cilia-and flagella-associated protein 96 n=1 Tax=Collichthys lucidus TaxID=240159 RepID=A0A4U5UDA3_COLLU|nr:UPF0602 protein C4orf47 -like protein [Collichthys lucidus]
MSYISVGDKYIPHTNRPFNESAYRSRQMQAGIAKQRCALQNGFFDKTFNRIFERSYYGTLSGPVEAMSPLSVPRKAHRPPGRNIVTSPPKKGSGYSYPNVTLSKIELYASDPYGRAKEALKREATVHRSKLRGGPFKLNLHPSDYFQGNPYRTDKPLPPANKPVPPGQKVSPVPFKPPSPSKKIGGMKAGTFDTYPSHSADPYIIRRSKKSNQEPVFRPAPGPKSTPVKSIIAVNVNRSVHSANYTSAIPTVMTV